MRADVLVVGAGPGGCAAALAAAEAGARVVLVEEHPPAHRKTCGEGVIGRHLREHGLATSAPYVMEAVERVTISLWGSVVYDRPTEGYTLDRGAFDLALARRAEEAGARVLFNTRARVAEAAAGLVGRVAIAGSRVPRTVEASLVVGADGVASRVGRAAGLVGPVRSEDLAVCAQCVVEGPVEPGRSRLVLGEATPGGYAWAFARGRGRANVGVGVEPRRARMLRRLLGAFLASEEDLRRCAAGPVSFAAVPCGGLLARLSAGNVALVGDAARQNDPVSAGGILQSMDAGRLAGAAAAEAASCEDPSLLASYDAAWRARYGGMHSLSLRLKDAARRLPPSLLLPAARLLFAAVPGDVFWLSDLDRDRMGKVLGRFER